MPTISVFATLVGATLIKIYLLTCQDFEGQRFKVAFKQTSGTVIYTKLVTNGEQCFEEFQIIFPEFKV